MKGLKWNYGIYEWKWKREWPTKQKFEGWKKDFLSLPEVKDYEVWVAGGFYKNGDHLILIFNYGMVLKTLK